MEQCWKCTSSSLPFSLPSQLTVEMERALPTPTPPFPHELREMLRLGHVHLPTTSSPLPPSVFIVLAGSLCLFLVLEHRSGISGLRIGSKHSVFLRGTDVLSLEKNKQAFTHITQRKDVSTHLCHVFGHYSCFFPPPCFCCLTLVPAKSRRHVRSKLIFSVLLLQYPVIHNSLVVTQPAWGHL